MIDFIVGMTEDHINKIPVSYWASCGMSVKKVLADNTCGCRFLT